MTYATILLYFYTPSIQKIMCSDRPLIYLLGQTMKLIRCKLMEKFKKNNLTLSLEHFAMLHFINEKNSTTQQDLANHFMRDKSIILRHVNTLIDLQYVVRTKDKDDKRKKNVMLTEKGKESLEFSKKLSHEVSAELLKGISEEELTQFENMISKIQSNTGFKECLSCY